jgi:two-component system chemotaxis response regulator CheY
VTTLLLLTPDTAVSAEIERVCARLGIRLRAVTTYEAAREWLSMQTFDILLVDVGAEPVRGLELLELGWKYAPVLTGGIFSLVDPSADSWSATLLGAKVFFGPSAIGKISDFLSSFPKNVTVAKEAYSAVLLVEDLDSPREIVATYIESLGFEKVVPAVDAAEALLFLRNKPQDYFCVISDLHMPRMDGIALTKEIRADPATHFLPVVILTADPTSENLLHCIKAGATGFLSKPPKKKTLLKELEKARRMVLFKQSPRLCDPHDTELLETALNRMKLS